MIGRRVWAGLVAAVVMVACAAGSAGAGLIVDYGVGDFAQTKLGNTVGTDFDRLYLAGLSGSLTLTENVTTRAQIGDLSWVVGFTGADSGGLKGPFTASRAIEVNGVTGTLSQPFTVNIGSYVDDFALQLGHVLTLDLGAAGFLDIQPLAVSGSSDGYHTFTAPVFANFLLHDAAEGGTPGSRIDEPGLVGWLALGLAAVVSLGLRRRRA